MDVIDEPPDWDLRRDPWMRPGLLDLLLGVRLGVGEAVEPGRRDRRLPRLLAEPVLQLAVGEPEHPAVGVIDDHDLPGAQQPGRENKRPDRVVIDHGAEVPDHVDIGSGETQHLLDAGQPGIRTGDDRDLGRRRSPAAGIVVVGDGCIGAQRLVDDTDDPFSFSLGVPVLPVASRPARELPVGHVQVEPVQATVPSGYCFVSCSEVIAAGPLRSSAGWHWSQDHARGRAVAPV